MRRSQSLFIVCAVLALAAASSRVDAQTASPGHQHYEPVKNAEAPAPGFSLN